MSVQIFYRDIHPFGQSVMCGKRSDILSVSMLSGGSFYIHPDSLCCLPGMFGSHFLIYLHCNLVEFQVTTLAEGGGMEFVKRNYHS